MAQRELGLAAGEPPTTRGYPPSVFNMLPRLVERAGRTQRGSITAFYTVLVEGDDHNEPIADALRGLLDGHFVLSRDLAARAHWPPIDILHSLSRLQPNLVSREALQAAAITRQHLSEYHRHADLISIGAYRQGSDPRVDAAIAMREPLNLFLQQEATQITKLEDSTRMLMQLASAQPVPTQVNANVSAQPPPAVSAVGESSGIVTS